MIAEILKRALQDVKRSCNKGEIKPKHIELCLDRGAVMKLNEIKSLLKDTVGQMNLEYIDSLRFKIEGQDLHIIMESKKKQDE